MKLFLRITLLLVCLAASVVADDTLYAVQSKLKRLGFYDGTVDGQMGSQTSAAIRRFQLAENLKVTGELNNPTLQKLGVSSQPAPSRQTQQPARQPQQQPPTYAPQPVPAYVALADIFKGGPYISIGPEGQIATIRQAQKNLRVLGYYNGPINGSPSPALVAGLKAWQQSARFRQTGRFDENTLKGLSLMPN